MKRAEPSKYERYHIETQPAPPIEKWPPRFRVKVGKIALAKFILSEILHYGPQNHQVILSRPCIYGVFSGPVGGFMPREHLCVGCLRCTTEFPTFIYVSPHPERLKLGDSYFTPQFVDTVNYEAETGSIPVKGAGYRGKFGGEGWDGMWTDMSEIVRPTRDGIHGREFISTVVDIGYKPNHLTFDEEGNPIGNIPHMISLPLPLLFDAASPSMSNEKIWKSAAHAAEAIGSLAILPLDAILKLGLQNDHTVPVIQSGDEEKLASLRTPRLILLEGWDAALHAFLRQRFPESLIGLRIPFSSSDELLEYPKQGIHIFHFLADFHGRNANGRFVLELIREAHAVFVKAGVREEVTLLASGGMIAAEHLPKAILCGLDAVAIDTPLIVALQGKFVGECRDRQTSRFILPKKLTPEWGKQRLMNLAASWRDQLLEISGAMGIRETRRMRGEMGRAMLMSTLEAEAFAGVDGYEHA
ncbi:MAG TPA: glutamate synthase-related protein [Anaerolineales bacterium]|nr:glutamate synthase-related protein [Anaerolineales bacterium]